MQAELTAAEANRRFYQHIAADYERSEICVFGRRQQERFRTALYDALSHTTGEPLALDACGGSGNASMALAERGVIPVVVDVSPEMIELWRRKALALGCETETHVQPIERFLAADSRRWDLITFCSALHHLEDYDDVLRLAAARLQPGGVIFTMFDPTRATPLVARLRKLDWAVHFLLTQPRAFLRKAAVTVGRPSRSVDPSAYVGRQAERHAYAGIDDKALALRAEEFGLDILVHDRYVDARLPIIAALFRVVGRPSHFHLVMQRPIEPTPH